MRISRYGNQNSELLDSFVKKASKKTQQDEKLSFEKIAQQIFEQENKPTLKEVLAQIDTPDIGAEKDPFGNIEVEDDPLADIPMDNNLPAEDLSPTDDLDEDDVDTDEVVDTDEIIKNSLIAAIAAAFGPDGIEDAISRLQVQDPGNVSGPETSGPEMPGPEMPESEMPESEMPDVYENVSPMAM